jgi:hypothetical protein
MKIVQCYFSLEIEPILDDTTLAQMFAITAGNLFYPVGSPNAGRQLHGALVPPSNIAPTFQILTNLGKAPIVCGVFDLQGDRVEGFSFNATERNLYFKPYQSTDSATGEITTITPVDTVASGWGVPKWD